LGRTPPHSEAWSKMMDDWSSLLRGDVLTTGQTKFIIKKQKNYTLVNSKVGYIFMPIYCALLQHFYDLIIIEQRPDDLYGKLISFLIYLNILKADKCCYRFTIDWLQDKYRSSLGMKIFMKHVLPDLKFVFSFDKRTKQYLNRITDEKKVYFIPGIDLTKYPEFPISFNSSFKILFASSPLNSDFSAFHEKGVEIVLSALKDLATSPLETTIFRLIAPWRSSSKLLNMRLSELDIGAFVDIYLGYVNIYKLLQESHITVFTPTSLTQSAQYPSSLIESLAVGRPVVVTDNLEISHIIRREKCGIVIKPSVHDLVEAIRQISVDYESYRSNCRRAAEKYFNLKKNLMECLPQSV
jgi:glycosyltransferase involved in cell wall biosynthesis